VLGKDCGEIHGFLFAKIIFEVDNKSTSVGCSCDWPI